MQAVLEHNSGANVVAVMLPTIAHKSTGLVTFKMRKFGIGQAVRFYYRSLVHTDLSGKKSTTNIYMEKA